MSQNLPLYGLLAEFEDAPALVEAARKTRDANYTKTDAYSPFPIEELADALGVRATRLPWLVLAGGLLGGLGGYFMQFYACVISFPLNVDGKPNHSWPSFMPVTFEMTVLFAAFTAVLAMLALNGLPQPYHPCFHIERFALATRDRFFLCIEASDPQFESDKTKEFLQSLGAREVNEVPR